MRLASLNLNKRLRTTAARAQLTAWLRERNVDVLAAQEPWKAEEGAAVTLDGYHHSGGDARLSVWVHERWTPVTVTRPETFVQRIELGWLMVFNTYLDAYAGTTRVNQLRRLRQLTLAESGRPMLLTGDFNLAPRIADGRFGEQPSTFNSESERASFRDLLASGRLVDTTAADRPDFTFVRMLNGQVSRFRCDLTLLSDHLQATTVIRYDHAPRVGEKRFTDHSAVLADLPVTLTAQTQQTLFSLHGDIPHDSNATGREADCQSHKTAMTRAVHSPAAGTVASVLVPKFQIVSVLDHGCGRGADVAHYRACGLDADGWDPYPGFGFSMLPGRTYDLVTSVFVLNVLPNPWERIQALQHAAGFVRPGGRMLVITRSPADIEPRAKTGGWKAHHDGYWSSGAKGTFQKGIIAKEIIDLACRAGMNPVDNQDLLPALASACQALLVRPEGAGNRPPPRLPGGRLRLGHDVARPDNAADETTPFRGLGYPQLL